MSYEVNICNQALGLLGDNRITSLEDNTKEARYCSMFFEQSAHEVFHKCLFRETISRQELVKLTSGPLYQWDYAYQLPTDFIRLIQVNNDDLLCDTRDFDIEGDQLLINDSVCRITYVRKITDFSKASPLLVKAISYMLAAKMAHALTGSINIMAEMESQAERTIAEANYRQKQESRSGENSRKKRYQQKIDLVRARGGRDIGDFSFDRYIPLISKIEEAAEGNIDLTNGQYLGDDGTFDYYVYDTTEVDFDWQVNRRATDGGSTYAKGTGVRPSNLAEALLLTYS